MIKKNIGIVIRDLLILPEDSIYLGRENEEQIDFNSDLIVIDSLGQAVQVSSGETFNALTDEMVYNAVMMQSFTIDIYGDNAGVNAVNLSMLLRSQKALELKESQSINILHTKGITDVKQLTGEQYQNRFQLEIIVEFCHSAAIGTLTIETPQLEVRTEERIYG